MTKAERAMFAGGLNPLTGQPLNSKAAAVAVPAFVTEAKQAQLILPQADRPWTYKSKGTSKSGRDVLVFSAPMRNGGTFESTLPGDLVRAIQQGKVIGLK